jgi:hypothetical protein
MFNNGGIIGPVNTATSASASGVWKFEEAQYAISIGNWPSPPVVLRTVEYLVVGGGGSGGVNVGGGGGAGGLTTGTFTATVGTAYTTTIGAGGIRGNQWSYSGYRGNSSTFATIIGKAGGAGLGITFRTGENTDVGSGGGGIDAGTYAGKAGTAGQGNSGGNGVVGTGSANYQGGGGGASGAGQAGQVNTAGGRGGLGTTSTISGTAVGYAGGGGGSNDTRGTGSGGTASHGGTAGGKGTTTSDASTNTGGGSGGVGYIVSGVDGNPYSGAGGSGVIVIRYSNTFSTVASQTGATYANTGGFHTYVFTSTGVITL